jgi:large subunit ribosomal protein L3
MAGHLAKAGVEAGHSPQGIPRSRTELANFKPGDVIAATIFQAGQKVDVTGTSQGKGFSGVIKRHHFSSNRASHGNSVSHNKPGSIGMNQDPGRVFPGQAHGRPHGRRERTTQNLVVVRVDEARQLLLVKGAVPGSRGTDVVVHPAVKA